MGTLALVSAIQHSDVAAIQSARKIGNGRQFEVWMGTECVTGLTTLQPHSSAH
jgi:hypothetical protein